jgi:hypothetical protein
MFLTSTSIQILIISKDAQTTSRQGGANSKNFQNSRGIKFYLVPLFEIFSRRNFLGGLHPLWASLIISDNFSGILHSRLHNEKTKIYHFFQESFSKNKFKMLNSRKCRIFYFQQ